MGPRPSPRLVDDYVRLREAELKVVLTRAFIGAVVLAVIIELLFRFNWEDTITVHIHRAPRP